MRNFINIITESINEGWGHYTAIGHDKGSSIVWYMLPGGKVILKPFNGKKDNHDGGDGEGLEGTAIAVGRIDPKQKKISVRTPLAPGNSFIQIAQAKLDYIAKKFTRKYPDYEIWYFGNAATDIRRIDEEVNLTEQTLMEAAGTYGFYQPKTKVEIKIPSGWNNDHADYIAEHPEELGLRPDQVRPSPHDDGISDDRMNWMAEMIDLTLALGWVRMNHYRGAWYFQARDLKTARAAVRQYDDIYYGLSEANVDIGTSSAHPETGFTLYPQSEVARFVKTGAIPR
jgi:hypothetical protein